LGAFVDDFSAVVGLRGELTHGILVQDWLSSG
jgi:hypothetical protein